jgi:hypothetical protein
VPEQQIPEVRSAVFVEAADLTIQYGTLDAGMVCDLGGKLRKALAAVVFLLFAQTLSSLIAS